MRFTDAAIRAIKPRAERFEVWEGGRRGFGLRVSPKGRKSWIFLYRFNGRPRRMTLGCYPAVGLADAHVRHAHAKAKLDAGTDPGAEKSAERKAETNAETVTDLVEEYLEKWARPRKRTAAEDERILRKDVIPEWGDRKAKDITRRDIVLLLDRVLDRGAPISANRLLAVTGRVFAFGVERDILGATPFVKISAPGQEKQRDRVLAPDEIKTLWAGLDDAAMSEASRLALKLMLVTAQRRGEVVAAAKGEFDLTEKVWTIPGERAKNGKAHRVPLSDMAIELIDNAIALGNDTRDDDAPIEWLFPSQYGDSPIAPKAVTQALSKSLKPSKRDGEQLPPAIPLNNVTPHDLRRSAASGMTALGVPRLTVSKILNHAEAGVTAIYDRHSYDQEKRQALEAWASRLQEIIHGTEPISNVVAMKQADH